MKRCRLVGESCGEQGCEDPYMDDHATGDWVPYGDAVAEIDRLNSECDRRCEQANQHYRANVILGNENARLTARLAKLEAVRAAAGVIAGCTWDEESNDILMIDDLRAALAACDEKEDTP